MYPTFKINLQILGVPPKHIFSPWEYFKRSKDVSCNKKNAPRFFNQLAFLKLLEWHPISSFHPMTYNLFGTSQPIFIPMIVLPKPILCKTMLLLKVWIKLPFLQRTRLDQILLYQTQLSQNKVNINTCWQANWLKKRLDYCWFFVARNFF